MPGKGKRLNKYVSDAGICSRRGADKLIGLGRIELVRASGQIEEKGNALNGSRVYEGDMVYVDGQVVKNPDPDKVYVLLNKPRGIICTSDLRVRNNVIDFLGFERYITYVGRLDKDSTGLLLLTNDGDLNNSMMRAANLHEKEYICTVDHAVTGEFLRHMGSGVQIRLTNSSDGTFTTKTRPCKIKQLGEREFSIILTQGLNRQIRRMCEALGYKALSINRIRIMNLKLGNLAVGAHRKITADELDKLKKMICGGEVKTDK